MRAQVNWKNMLVAAVCSLSLFLSSGAWAGQVEHPPVTVDVDARTAECSFVGARYVSNNDRESCFCYLDVNTLSEEPYAVCEAKDVDGREVTCYSDKPAYVDAMLSVKDYSHIAFTAELDADGVNVCNSLRVSTFSKYNPESPTGPQPQP